MLKLISAVQYSTKMKATIQATGKLGFTKETAEIWQLNQDNSIQFARDEEDNNQLYLILYPDVRDEAFRVNKSGDYFYLATKLMFDDFGIDYKTTNVMFDLVRTESQDPEDGAKAYRMDMRHTDRKRGDNTVDIEA